MYIYVCMYIYIYYTKLFIINNKLNFKRKVIFILPNEDIRVHVYFTLAVKVY